jgi:hypothetical protein
LKRHRTAVANGARRAAVGVVALFVAACAGAPPSVPGLAGTPIGEFFDDVKAEHRVVHWRVRSDRAACGTTDKREIDLRNASITLDLQRIGEASMDGTIRIVAFPLAGGNVSPFASATASRKSTQEIVLKLDVAGSARLYDAGESPNAAGSIARNLNAAIDGFVRSSADEPCIRLAALKLTYVIDVRQEAGGGFRLVVPPAELGIDSAHRDVNTLTLSWDKIESNALR